MSSCWIGWAHHFCHPLSFEKSHKTNLPNWKDDENFDIFIHVLRHPSYLFYYYSSMSASRLSLSVICELRVPFFFISLMLLLWRHSLFCFWGWWIFYSLMGWLGTLITKPLENFWYYMISWFFFFLLTQMRFLCLFYIIVYGDG